MSSEMLKRSHISASKDARSSIKADQRCLDDLWKIGGPGDLAPSGKILTFLSKALSGVQRKVQFWTSLAALLRVLYTS